MGRFWFYWCSNIFESCVRSNVQANEKALENYVGTKYPSMKLLRTAFIVSPSNNAKLLSSLAEFIASMTSIARQHTFASISQTSWLTRSIWAFPAFLRVISKMKRMRWRNTCCFAAFILRTSCQKPSALLGMPSRSHLPFRSVSRQKAAG